MTEKTACRIIQQSHYQLSPETLDMVLNDDDRLITRICKHYEKTKETLNPSIHFVRNLFGELEGISSTFDDGSRSEPERAIKVLNIGQEPEPLSTQPKPNQEKSLQEIYKESRPVRWSLAENYLKEQCRIDPPYPRGRFAM